MTAPAPSSATSGVIASASDAAITVTVIGGAARRAWLVVHRHERTRQRGRGNGRAAVSRLGDGDLCRRPRQVGTHANRLPLVRPATGGVGSRRWHETEA